MISRSLLLATCLAAVACGSSLGSGQDGAAGAGGGGRGGTAGFGWSLGLGQDGAAGADGIATCVSGYPYPGFVVFSDDSTHPFLPVTAPVTVVSVDDLPPDTTGIHIVLSEASGRRWSAYATFSRMQADIVAVGDALDLRIELNPVPTNSPNTVLARGGTAVIFDVSGVSAASDLTPYGITVTRSTSAPCQDGSYTAYSADVSYGTESRNVAPNHTVQIGKLSFSLRGFGDLTDAGDTPPGSMSGFTVR